MTIICAAHAEDGWHIGCDLRMTLGADPIPVGPKWVTGEGFAIGVSGSTRAFEILRAHLVGIASCLTPWGMVHEWRRQIISDGFTPKRDEEGPQKFGSTGLLVMPQHGIWHIDAALTPVRVERSFMAAGSGADHADGAVWARNELLRGKRGMRRSAALEVEIALGCAIALDGACIGALPWVSKIG